MNELILEDEFFHKGKDWSSYYETDKVKVYFNISNYKDKAAGLISVLDFNEEGYIKIFKNSSKEDLLEKFKTFKATLPEEISQEFLKKEAFENVY